MIYQGKEVEILFQKTVFGKSVAEIKILSSGEIKSVPYSELSDEKKIPTGSEISYKAIAPKSRSLYFCN